MTDWIEANLIVVIVRNTVVIVIVGDICKRWSFEKRVFHQLNLLFLNFRCFLYKRGSNLFEWHFHGTVNRLVVLGNRNDLVVPAFFPLLTHQVILLLATTYRVWECHSNSWWAKVKQISFIKFTFYKLLIRSISNVSQKRDWVGHFNSFFNRTEILVLVA